ncbi:acetyltransferase [Companilactobacillus bobalius]|nr:acetyltransferase [Companilactobacillus bobalius]
MVDQTVEKNTQIINEINYQNQTIDDGKELFSRLFGYQVPSTSDIKAPFNADLGCHTFVKGNVFINKDCFFMDLGGIWIDEGAKLGPRVSLITVNHGEAPAERRTLITKSIHIERNVWLGTGVTVLPGVTIGENSIVGAASVVTKDVAPNSVVVGSPAKKIRDVRG